MKSLDEIEKIILESKQITKETTDSLLTFIVKNNHLFELQTLSPEDQLDFYEKIYPQLRNVINNFNPAKGSFYTYLYNFIKINLKSFIYKKRSATLYEECTSEINVNSYENTESLYAQQEYSYKIDEEEPLIYDIIRVVCNIPDQDTREELMESITLVILKYSFHINADLLSFVCTKFNLDEEEIFLMHKECLDSLSKRLNKKEEIERKVSYLYFKINYYSHQISINNEDNIFVNTYSKKKDELQKRMDKKLYELKYRYGHLLISNSLLSQLLDIPLGRTNYICKRFINYMDKFLDSSYSNEYENLFSNRKSKQKKRNAGTISRAYDCYTKRRGNIVRSRRNRINLLRK